MPRPKRSFCRLFTFAWIAVGLCSSQSSLANDIDYLPPTNYYSSAAGLTGSALKSQLASIMTSGFVARSYGDARYAYAVTDRDPNNPNNILLIYNRASVSSTWDGGATYNREHQWPVSKLGMSSPSNSYKGVASDLHMLRPSNPSINSARSNEYFGTTANSGSYHDNGSSWYPGDADSGDVARTMFYAATRWNSFNNLTLVNGSPSTYQMGDLNSLLHWHYTDTPDNFEMYRNQAVYSSTLNPSYYQGNRNAYVDHPEYVWSVFVDQANDTQLTTSTSSVDLGRVIVGSSFANQNLTINKAGLDGTYYEVRTAGDATSTVSGRMNAFAMDTTGSKVTSVGLSASTATAGLKSGTVTVDNLDVTTQGGAGLGANDVDDVVTVSGDVLDHALPSFNGLTADTSLTLDFGTLAVGSGTHALSFDLHNLVQTADYTAALDLDSFNFSGDAGVFSTNLNLFSNLVAGSSLDFSILFDASQLGMFSGTYSLFLSDEDIPGAQSFAPLTVNVLGSIVQVPEPASLLLLGIGIVALVALRRRQNQRKSIL